ncbi:PR domain zinc finger protein 5 [Microdochium nivale]|nr:PR domain zinc finger protein 5 [Microdochium nivale]
MAFLHTGFTGSLDPDHGDQTQPRPSSSHMPGNKATHHALNHPITPAESHLLSPYSSAHAFSSSASPDGLSYTPNSSLSLCPSGEFIPEHSDDQFYGASFNDLGSGNTPSFLEDEFLNLDGAEDTVPFPDLVASQPDLAASSYPISPDKTPLMNNSSGVFNSSKKITPIISQRSLDQSAPHSVDSSQTAPQLTPDTNDGGWSGDENLVPFTSLAMISPHVTVSEWESNARMHETQYTPGLLGSPLTARAPHSTAGDFAGNNDLYSLSGASRNAQGSDGSSSPHGGRHGQAPALRSGAEVHQSINQQATDREVIDKNQELQAWISRSRSASIDPDYLNKPADNSGLGDNNVSSREIPLGNHTVNRHVEGQVYYNATGNGPVNETDIRIMRETLPWESGLRMQEIQNDRTVPETAQQAIARLQRQFDSASIVSRAATWGTRRRASLPSIVDVEGVISGNFLKKLSISGRDNHVRRPSLISRIPSLVRKTSTNQRKRKPAAANEPPPDQQEHHELPERRESKDSLAPPSRTSSWGFNKKQMPSLNTAVFEMGAGAASIGSGTPARNGSVSAATVTSPKSTFGGLSSFKVPPIKNTLQRPRSKTELPVNSRTDPQSALFSLLKAQGGPPVAQLAKSRNKAELDEDDDEDDEDDDTQIEVDNHQEIIPTTEGFKRHIVRLNPVLANKDGLVHDDSKYLVDRIAHSMVMRYKHLLSLRVKHIGITNARACPSGRMCMDLGGSAIILEPRSDARGPDSSDGDGPLEGLSSENFPAGIPLPPTTSLPAEFECQLCFNHKKFTKPSDWTKHVHEDVQPFTCTWDRCRDTKMFKRKADWVRHENEGHRHLEWWTCDVDDCRHICYRRDNFLQHLVREHKFPEPKVKMKAQVKKAGGSDPTWVKVEQCHTETNVKPSDEPCRFCHRTFPTWKKLTVHLAKHMEHISLPVLRLVLAKELDADTIISPVQDAPPHSYASFPTAQSQIKQEPRSFPMPNNFMVPCAGNTPYHHQPNFGLGMMPPSTYSQPMETSYYAETSLAQNTGLLMAQSVHGLPQAHYHVQTTSGPHFNGGGDPYMNMIAPDAEAFPDFQTDSLGIQNASGQPMGYGHGLVNPSAQAISQAIPQYNHHGSASPYSRSPQHGPIHYYGP